MKCVNSREKMAGREETIRRILSVSAATVVFGMIGFASLSDPKSGIGLEHAAATVEIAARSPARAPDSDREKTYRQFSEIYGGESPLIEPLFDWAVLGFRTDHGNPAYALERQRLLAQLSQNPEATLALLRRGQGRLPADWDVVRDSLTRLDEILSERRR